MWAASSPLPAGVWRQRIADEVQRATEASFVAVYTCPQGDPFRSIGAVAGASAWSVVQSTHTKFLAYWERVGGGIDGARVLGSLAHAPLLDTPHRDLAPELRREIFAPRSIRGLVNAFVTTHDGAPVGWIALGTAEPARIALGRYGTALGDVARAAGDILSCAFDLAGACGFRQPAAPPSVLSARERQIAMMVASGLSDANVAARLSLSEETVGSHLRRIYRKLGVHTRVALAARLARVRKRTFVIAD